MSHASRTLYRTPNATQAAQDLGLIDGAQPQAQLQFDKLKVSGAFEPGDIVLPMLAGAGGEPRGSSLKLGDQGRSLELVQPEVVTQAQLFLNTHEPVQKYTR